jgi:demethylspheroidene O-methyltransferase
VLPTAHRRWRESWEDWRDVLLSDPRFHAWALRVPGARGIARRRARALFDLCAGFAYSQVLLACVRLRVLESLTEGSRAIDQLVAGAGLSRAAMERLLQAAAALGLVERRGHEQFGLGTLGAALVANPAVAAMIEHHALLYDDLRDPVALLRGACAPTRLKRYWAYADDTDSRSISSERAAAYTLLMATSQQLIADDVVSSYPVARHRRWLDVGGGDGAFLQVLAARAARVTGICFDVPGVAAAAQERFRTAGLAQMLAIGGDMLHDTLPPGNDAVSLIRVLHDHDDAAALRILRSAHAALSDNGRIIVAEPMTDSRRADPIADAYFGMYLLAMGQGRIRTHEEIGAMLRGVGFERPMLVANRNPVIVRVLVARKRELVVN